ncbi:MAG: hypothetical protein V2A70_00995 [Candidatus Omnitrophota bacterium]
MSPSTLPTELALDTKATQVANRSPNAETQEFAKNIIREIILPEIEKEVNEGKNFSTLRQMFYAMILATWYKRALVGAIHESPLHQVYVDKAKTSGVLSDDPKVGEKIYAQYLEAYKKGVFNYIKDGVETLRATSLQNDLKGPRQEFSGGLQLVPEIENVQVVTPLEMRGMDHAMLLVPVQILRVLGDRSQSTNMKELAGAAYKREYDFLTTVYDALTDDKTLLSRWYMRILQARRFLSYNAAVSAVSISEVMVAAARSSHKHDPVVKSLFEHYGSEKTEDILEKLYSDHAQETDKSKSDASMLKSKSDAKDHSWGWAEHTAIGYTFLLILMGFNYVNKQEAVDAAVIAERAMANGLVAEVSSGYKWTSGDTIESIVAKTGVDQEQFIFVNRIKTDFDLEIRGNLLLPGVVLKKVIITHSDDLTPGMIAALFYGDSRKTSRFSINRYRIADYLNHGGTLSGYFTRREMPRFKTVENELEAVDHDVARVFRIEQANKKLDQLEASRRDPNSNPGYVAQLDAQIKGVLLELEALKGGKDKELVPATDFAQSDAAQFLIPAAATAGLDMKLKTFEAFWNKKFGYTKRTGKVFYTTEGLVSKSWLVHMDIGDFKQISQVGEIIPRDNPRDHDYFVTIQVPEFWFQEDIAQGFEQVLTWINEQYNLLIDDYQIPREAQALVKQMTFKGNDFAQKMDVKWVYFSPDMKIEQVREKNVELLQQGLDGPTDVQPSYVDIVMELYRYIDGKNQYGHYATLVSFVEGLLLDAIKIHLHRLKKDNHFVLNFIMKFNPRIKGIDELNGGDAVALINYADASGPLRGSLINRIARRTILLATQAVEGVNKDNVFNKQEAVASLQPRVMFVLAMSNALRGDFDFEQFMAEYNALSYERGDAWTAVDSVNIQGVLQRLQSKELVAMSASSSREHPVYHVTSKGWGLAVAAALRQLFWEGDSIEVGAKDGNPAKLVHEGAQALWREDVSNLASAIKGDKDLRKILGAFLEWYKNVSTTFIDLDASHKELLAQRANMMADMFLSRLRKIDASQKISKDSVNGIARIPVSGSTMKYFLEALSKMQSASAPDVSLQEVLYKIPQKFVGLPIKFKIIEQSILVNYDDGSVLIAADQQSSMFSVNITSKNGLNKDAFFFRALSLIPSIIKFNLDVTFSRETDYALIDRLKSNQGVLYLHEQGVLASPLYGDDASNYILKAGSEDLFYLVDDKGDLYLGDFSKKVINDQLTNFRSLIVYPVVASQEGAAPGAVILISDVDNAAVPGGIDLNANNMGLDVAKDGKGVQMPFDPAMVAEFRQGDFSGVEGIILRIVPIESPLPLLGLERSVP